MFAQTLRLHTFHYLASRHTNVKIIKVYKIYLLIAIGLPPSGRSTVHTYIQTIQRTTQFTNYEIFYTNYNYSSKLDLRENK
jgi:hypothetical protein